MTDQLQHLRETFGFAGAVEPAEKKFNPSQPRHPEGDPLGGQWAAAGGASSSAGGGSATTVKAFGKEMQISPRVSNAEAAVEAIAIYSKINDKFPYPELEEHASSIASGVSDHWRGAGVVLSAISQHCRIGRIGFDDKKYKRGVDWAIGLFNKSKVGIPQGLHGVNTSGY